MLANPYFILVAIVALGGALTLSVGQRCDTIYARA